MSKELDKLEEIKHRIIYNADSYASLRNEEVNFLITVAKSSLQRLESIDNANPSEALESFENLRCNLYNEPYLDEHSLDDCATIKQALLKAQEQEKENAKYKKSEEEIGCPLEVVRQLFKQDFIYFKYLGNIQIMKVKVCKGLSYGTNLGWYVTCIYDNIDFEYISLQDYKKTWWLREDKSE